MDTISHRNRSHFLSWPTWIYWSVNLGIAVFQSLHLRAQSSDEFERPPIEYSATKPNDLVTALKARIENGSLQVPAVSDREFVQWLLREFQIPEASQILVFSQTSLQNDRIRPSHPRAVYFSDDVYLGWVPGGLVELTPMDPTLGPTFYTVDPQGVMSGKPAERVSHIRRDADCLRCHGTFVRDIPSVLARSVSVDTEGRPTGTLGGRLVDLTTPFSDRWGGWYVTGRHGSGRHRGNIVPANGQDLSSEERDRGANLLRPPDPVNTSRYLSSGSDIVALMVFEHQLTVHNAITRAAHHTRRMMHYQEGVQRGLGEKVTAEPVYESARRAIATSAQDLLDALLSHEEAPLPEGGIEGNPAFREAYEKPGPRSKDGQSLRTLDLKTRLYRYRCSPLIYTASFTGLPGPLKSEVLRRLKITLNSMDADARYSHLRPGERRMIREILRETLPAYAAIDR